MEAQMGGSTVLAVDIGGTWVRAALVSADGRIHHRTAIPTPHADPAAIAIPRLARDVAAVGQPARCVVGVPGRVDYGRGALEYARNLPATWPDALDEQQLSEAIGLPVCLGRDADLAAVGEAYFGAGIGYDDVVYVTLSTGVGAGALVGRRVLHGRRSMVEIGLTRVRAGGAHAEARRPQLALLEDLASGTALAKLAKKAGLGDDGGALVQRVRAGDLTAVALWGNYCRNAGIALSNLAHILAPQVIVVGGGVSQAGDLLLEPLRSAVAELGPQHLPSPIEVQLARLGDDSGLVGAAAWEAAFTAYQSA